ncbi:MAG: O-antigen ligase family protein [Pyrinomonadaceae bacterium]
MTSRQPKNQDYPNVASANNGRDETKNGYAALSPSKKKTSLEIIEPQTFSSPKKTAEITETLQSNEKEIVSPPAIESLKTADETEDLSFAEKRKLDRKNKKLRKAESVLSRDNWLARNGHAATYFFLYLFSAFVFFRPYEWLPQLSFLQVGAFVLALLTLLVYLPAQFSTEGSLTILTTEVKSVLCLVGLALLTMPISKNPALSWQTFNDTFIKAVVMFIVMVNVLRTRRRLMGIMWISFGISLVLSYIAIGMYMRGELKAEGYRVEVDFGGMLGNPNDMALHLVTMTPLVICLGIATKNSLLRLVYFTMAVLFVAASVVTFSRGAFLGLLVVGAMLVWKIGRKQRFNAIVASIVVGGLFILLAPGNYGMRLLSIFVPGLDAVGSSDQRRELLQQSIQVTLRNPWGIGIGCFPEVSQHNLQTHNAFTQVSSELGILGLAAYLIFMVSPVRKLAAIERTLFENGKTDWYYYLAIGLQASIAGFMVSSFFGPVAYNWFVYYLVAYAVAFRRIYQIEKGDDLKNTK